MRTVKKLMGFTLAAGLMMSSMTVFAAYPYEQMGDDFDWEKFDPSKGGVYDHGVWYDEEGEGHFEAWFEGKQPPSWEVPDGSWWNDTEHQYYNGKTGEYEPVWYEYKDGEWVCGVPGYDEESGSGSSDAKGGSSNSIVEAARINQRAAAEAEQKAASDEGFADVGDMYRAAENSMNSGEFYNNAVVSTPGIEDAIPVGQDGNLVVDGQVTNMTATITKVTNRAYVDSVRVAQAGKVLNVVDVSYPAVNATVTFYMPGVTGGENIVALQYNAGTWVNVEVSEVRADHVTLNMKGNGVVAFIAQ